MSFFKSQNHARELELDEKEARRLQHLRTSRTERFEKMLDPRCAIGSDTAALEAQSRMKSLALSEARAEKEADRATLQATMEALSKQEAAERAARRARSMEVAKALDSQVASQPTRTTWDLEDPLSQRNSAPVRKGLDDPRLGLSSAQVFSGEDPTARQRTLLQQAQVRAWTAQMVSEKQAQKEAQKKWDEDVAGNMVRCAQMAGEIEAAGIAEQRAKERASARQNEQTMVEKRAERLKSKEEDKAAGLLTFDTMNTRGAGMGLLAEDVSDGISASSPRRYRPDYFRGIPATSPNGALSALATVEAQLEAKRAREAGEREAKAAQARQDADELRSAALLERAEKEAREAASRATAQVLTAQKALAEEKRRLEREGQRNNGIGHDFYKHFGKAF